MILQCPACNAKYAVPDHAIGAEGRAVRCNKCANEWFVAPPRPATDEAALEALLKEPEAPVLRAMPRGSSPPAKKIPKVTLGLKVALAASFLIALAATALKFTPGLLGYGKTQDIVLSDLSLQKQEVERGMEYAVSGKLVNTSKVAQRPVPVRIVLLSKDGSPLQYWEPMMPEMLEPMEPMPFTFGPLRTPFMSGDRILVELGNPLELALRRKP